MDATTINHNLEIRCSQLRAALEQIVRLSKEADRSQVDVATMLGEIAIAALTKTN